MSRDARGEPDALAEVGGVSVVAPRRSSTVIPHWPGRGSLTIVVDGDGRILLRADQVEQLAGIPPWSGGETLLEDHWTLIDGRQFYLLDDAITRCELAGTDVAAEFLSWLRPTIDELDDDLLDLARPVLTFVGSYPVGRAAEILDRDPAISIGRQGLFAHMATLGWISRADPSVPWAVTEVADRAGWLTARRVIVTAGRRETPYPQVYVTPAGLTELRRQLLALNAGPPPDLLPQPTLFD